MTKQPGKAHKVLNRALQILPEDAEIRTWLGLSYIKSNRLEEGLEEIMQAVQSDPIIFQPISIWGCIYQNQIVARPVSILIISSIGLPGIAGLRIWSKKLGSF